MLKFLKGVVAGSGAGIKDFPYNIGVPYSSAWGSWTHYSGTNKVLDLPLSFQSNVLIEFDSVSSIIPICFGLSCIVCLNSDAFAL